MLFGLRRVSTQFTSSEAVRVRVRVKVRVQIHQHDTQGQRTRADNEIALLSFVVSSFVFLLGFVSRAGLG